MLRVSPFAGTPSHFKTLGRPWLSNDLKSSKARIFPGLAGGLATALCSGAVPCDASTVGRCSDEAGGICFGIFLVAQNQPPAPSSKIKIATAAQIIFPPAAPTSSL